MTVSDQKNLTLRSHCAIHALGIAVAVLTAGCAVPVQPVIPRIDFPVAEYRALPKAGDATIKGQAFLKTRGGDVKTAAGSEVYLNPVTSYSLEWYDKSYTRNLRLSEADVRQLEYIRTQTADSSGRFIFRNVPTGEYFLTAQVTWEAPTGYQGSLQKQGGYVTKRVKVGPNEEVDVIVTR